MGARRDRRVAVVGSGFQMLTSLGTWTGEGENWGQKMESPECGTVRRRENGGKEV